MQIDLSLFMSDRQFGYFGHWKHLLSLLHYREFWGRRQGGKGGGVRMSGTQCAEVIQVIRTKENIGDGTVKDPVRIVIRYWDFEGNLLAENDSFCK